MSQDVVANLRELMAKADAASAARRNSGEPSSSDYDVACLKEDYADRELSEALRNLAPQLLEVVEAAAEYQDAWPLTDKHKASWDRLKRAREALAALGGNGGGGK